MNLIKNKTIEINSYIKKGNLKKAQLVLSPLIKRFPSEFTLLQLQVMIYLSQNDDINALKYMYKMVEIKEHESIFNNIGNIEKKLGNLNKAIEYYKKALSLQDTNPNIYFNIANCYSALKQKNEAITNYEKTLEIDDNYYNAHNNLGLLYLNSSDFIKSEFHFCEALKLLKNFPEAILNLYFSYIFQEKISEAVSLLSKAVEDNIINEKILFYKTITSSYEMDTKILDDILLSLNKNQNLFIWLSEWKYLFSKKSSDFSITRTFNENFSFAIKQASKNGLFLEFGVGSGFTANIISSQIETDLHGFDCFEGIPEEWNNHPAGSFSTNGELPLVNSNVKLYKGYFDKTFPDFCNNLKETISFMHIDCDLFSSTKSIFDFFGNNINEGTVILFDELIGYDGFEDHELKAFKDFININNLEFECLGLNYLSGQAIIRII